MGVCFDRLLVLESVAMYAPPELIPSSPVVSVGDLVRRARELLEHNLPLLWVSGEISNFTRATSGHWYFSLKDNSAQVRCVLFRNKSQYLDWVPENGMQVEVRALATLYEARGEFQLNIETMRRAGLGALYAAFEKLKIKLGQEGLFDSKRKRPLPAYSRQIGIITSPAAAALKDVLNTLNRRMPAIPVVLYPAPVQGEGAAEKIATAIQIAGNRAECDVLILCRGGGSIEDLWPFNEEVVARAIHASPIPVISGIGHETDFTIADFVSDQRAPTPTAAAELITPDRENLLHQLAVLAKRLHGNTQRRLEDRVQHVDYLSRRLIHPGEKLLQQWRQLSHLRGRLQQTCNRALDDRNWQVQFLVRQLTGSRPDFARREEKLLELARRMQLASDHRLAKHATQLENLALNLEHLNPLTILARGFSIVENESGELLRDSAQATPGTGLKITLARGWLKAEVTKNEAGESP